MRRARAIRLLALAGGGLLLTLAFATGPGAASGEDARPLGALVGRDGAKVRIYATPAGPRYLREHADGRIESIEPVGAWAGVDDPAPPGME